MAQRPKEHVREALLAAAARELATHGLGGATLATVAKRAGTSIGNLYKYFQDKDALVAAALPPSLLSTLSKLVRSQVRSLEGHDLSQLARAHPYRERAADLLEFSLQRRDEVLFLLTRAEGTRFGAFRHGLEKDLVGLALSWARLAHPGYRPSASTRRTLSRIYRGFLGSLADILAREAGQRATRAAVSQFVAYHLAGLRALFAADAGHREPP